MVRVDNAARMRPSEPNQGDYIIETLPGSPPSFEVVRFQLGDGRAFSTEDAALGFAVRAAEFYGFRVFWRTAAGGYALLTA